MVELTWRRPLKCTLIINFHININPRPSWFFIVWFSIIVVSVINPRHSFTCTIHQFFCSLFVFGLHNDRSICIYCLIRVFSFFFFNYCGSQVFHKILPVTCFLHDYHDILIALSNTWIWSFHGFQQGLSRFRLRWLRWSGLRTLNIFRDITVYFITCWPTQL